MRRPRIIVPCIADAYVGDKRRQRIIEFSMPSGKGGLISFRQNQDGTVAIHVYRTDPGVTVTSDERDGPPPTNAFDGAHFRVIGETP